MINKQNHDSGLNNIRKRRLNLSNVSVNTDTVSIPTDDELDSDVEIIEINPKDQIIVLDEDSCHLDDNSTISLDKKSSKTPIFGESFIPLNSTVHESPLKSILPEYKSNLMAIQKPSSPNITNKSSVTEDIPFYEDKCPSTYTTPIPIYDCVFSSESAMLQGGNKKVNTPAKPKRQMTPKRKSTLHSEANNSIVFVSETILPDQTVLAMRQKISKANKVIKKKETRQQRLARKRKNRRLSNKRYLAASNIDQYSSKDQSKRNCPTSNIDQFSSKELLYKIFLPNEAATSTHTTNQPTSETFYNSSVISPSSSTKRMVIIDGSNLAYFHSHQNGFSVKGIEICLEFFEKQGHEARAVIPQNRLNGTRSSDPKRLHELLKEGKIVVTPCKNLPGIHTTSYDDRFIFTLAEQFDAAIISNDNFRDMAMEKPEWKKIAETRVIGFTFFKDAIILPSDPYGQIGPTLYQILNRIESETKKPNAENISAPETTSTTALSTK